MLEAINVASDTSFKVASYYNSNNCESAGWHIHPELELVCVKNGSGCLHIGTKKMNYSDGVLVFLGGNIPHADFGNKDYEDSTEVVIQFKKDFLDEKLRVFPELSEIKNLVKRAKEVLVFDTHTKNTVWKLFEQFELLDNQGKLINLLNILNYLSKHGQYQSLFDTLSMEKFKKSEIWRLEETFEYVNNNYHKSISVHEISSRLGLTPNSFCRFFKKMTQRRFIDFVNEFRIERAVELFNANNTVVSEVMFNSGYNDPSYFAKQFKKYQGMSPSNYLKTKYGASLLQNSSL